MIQITQSYKYGKARPRNWVSFRTAFPLALTPGLMLIDSRTERRIWMSKWKRIVVQCRDQEGGEANWKARAEGERVYQEALRGRTWGCEWMTEKRKGENTEETGVTFWCISRKTCLKEGDEIFALYPFPTQVWHQFAPNIILFALRLVSSTLCSILWKMLPHTKGERRMFQTINEQSGGQRYGLEGCKCS